MEQRKNELQKERQKQNDGKKARVVQNENLSVGDNGILKCRVN